MPIRNIYIIISFLSVSLMAHAQLADLNKDLPCLNKVVNVHAHVVLDSLGNGIDQTSLETALEGANQFYEPICLSFKLCGIDSITNYEFDSLGRESEEKDLDRQFFLQNRINFYLISEFSSPGLCGKGGGSIVYLKCIDPITIAHELGHVFGLAHTFGGVPELVDGSNCDTAADGICDTPADPYVEDSNITYLDDCEFVFQGRDANGDFYQPDVGNIMSYYECRCGFTRQQYLHMVENYQSRSKLW